MTTTVNDIEHIESQTLAGISVVKVFFQPKARIDAAVSQVTAIAQTVLRTMPPGTTPPLVITYSASTVPVLQLALSGQGLSEQQLFDLGNNNAVRSAARHGRGAPRSVPLRRQAAADPGGPRTPALQRKGSRRPTSSTRSQRKTSFCPRARRRSDRSSTRSRPTARPSSSRSSTAFRSARRNGAVVYFHDVAHVRDGSPPQTNIVRVDGQRASLLTTSRPATLRRSTSSGDPGHGAEWAGRVAAGTRRSYRWPISRSACGAAISGIITKAMIGAGLTGSRDPDLPRQLADGRSSSRSRFRCRS